ncbi:hypothetical protein R1sor_014238 [Riccia sorocarpa]|uniref:Endonuclease/exonuclease/phosphatase domain-containing protein n=1 Tax=Riccia sorocarpa TaxID=122646 RepID=A0ABD3HBP5_9MARC
MEGNIHASMLAPEELWSILDTAEILREPIRSEAAVAAETGLTSELQGRGNWKNARVESRRDPTEQHRKKYNTLITALRSDRGLPVWAHTLWNCRSVPPHTAFGTLLEGYDGFYRAGLEVGIGGFNFADIPVGTTTEIVHRPSEPNAEPLPTATVSSTGLAHRMQMVNRDRDLNKGEENIPPLAKVLLVLETFGASIADIQVTVVGLNKTVEAMQENTKRELAGLRADYDQVRAQLDSLVARTTAESPKERFGAVESELRLLHKEQRSVLSTLNRLEECAAGQTKIMADHTLMLKESKSTIPPTDFATVMTGLDEKMRTYAETVRDTQVVALRERDNEQTDRARRPLNLRVIGLTEEEDEDMKEQICTFFRDVLRVASPQVESANWEERSRTKHCPCWSEAVAQGGTELWSKADVVGLAETWDIGEEPSVDLPGFMCIRSLTNKRRYNKGRGFGGLAVWVRTELNVDIEIEFEDTRKQFIILKIGKEGRFGFITFCYFAPACAPVYNASTEGGSLFLEIARKISGLGDRGDVWILRDFNSRTRSTQGMVPHTQDVIWRQNEIGRRQERSSEDTGINRFTESFLQFVSACNLTILNGTERFPDTQGFTCFTPMGSSTVDNLLGSDGANSRVLTFSIESRVPESDHTPLLCTLGGVPRQPDTKKTRRNPMYLDMTLRVQYKQAVTLALQQVDVTVNISHILARTARLVFQRRQLTKQSWFDLECQEAHRRTLSCTDENQQERYQAYKKLICGKKRSFTREQQLILTAKLMREPQLFWTRFQPKRLLADLPVRVLSSMFKSYISSPVLQVCRW